MITKKLKKQFRQDLKSISDQLGFTDKRLESLVKVSNIINQPTTLMKEPVKPKKTIPTTRRRNRGGA